MNPIYHRVSIRKYQERPVENEKILQILKAGMQAPSACNQQPWEFYVVTDKEKIGLLSQTTPYAGCAAGAPVVIIPVYRTESLPAPSMIPIDMGLYRKISGWRQMLWGLVVFVSVFLLFQSLWNLFAESYNFLII